MLWIGGERVFICGGEHGVGGAVYIARRAETTARRGELGLAGRGSEGGCLEAIEVPGGAELKALLQVCCGYSNDTLRYRFF